VIGEGERAVLLYNGVRGNRIPRTSGARSRKFAKIPLRSSLCGGCASDVPPATPHRATILLLKNVNPKIVSEMLGHASLAITLDTYSHVLPNMQYSAVAAMEETLS
jgi:integrase